MKKLVKYILLALLFALLVTAVALAAAPVFVRQEQVKSFIESKVKLSDGKKLKLEGKIKFGIFPYMHAQIPEVQIVAADGTVQKFADFHAGFNTADLMNPSITFNSSFLNEGNEYEGSFYVKDYEAYMKQGVSDVAFDLKKPLVAKIKGNLSHKDNVYTLKDFEISYKDTLAKGNLKVTMEKNNVLQIDLNTQANSKNIEDIRRLIQLGRNNETFNLLSGEGKVGLNATTKGATIDEFKRNLNGEGDVNVNDARVYGIDIKSLIGAPQEARMTKDQSRYIAIMKADSIFKINNGIVKIEELNAQNNLANIKAHGTVNIPESEVKVDIDLDAEMMESKIKVPLLAYGKFSDVRFVPRVGDAVMGNINSIKQIKLKDVKLKISKKSLEQLKDIGKSLGLNVEKITDKMVVPQDVAEPAEPAIPATPATPAAPKEPATP